MKDRMRQRVLIANRGEIAVRAIRSCRSLGLESIAVYSTADQSAPHAWLADQAFCIGPPLSRQSYLSMDALLHVARESKCQLVYPGYGFLAENAEFAERCSKEGLIFVGPSPENIQEMGDKACARVAAKKFGVPIVPGSPGTFTDAVEALAAADDIGFPLLLKASAGGGGRGMRVVEDRSQFSMLFNQASQEAREAFGNPAVYLERYFPAVRHIEVQIFGDAHGTVRHLGERDCTTQRRHQKLVEESPSPVLTDKERAGVLEAAVKLAAGVKYQGAGTVEFIFDEGSREFFFIEMNTRIQVEHPVTEMCIGHDLIIEQLRVAMGEGLSIPKESDWPGGHAIEFRINAEDPVHDFRPSPGRVHHWRPPQGAGIRVDSFVYKGIDIQPFYDSMIAKLIVHGADRESALERARSALDAFEIDGPATSRSFHRALIDDPDFVASKIHTRWVENTFLQRFTDEGR
ncbi:MAG: acetyl-CoA carboxylase biotin carboxylase subunit [Alphaproteobacteria bacterium]|jgi:acetyl-CoA carboxylase biotin carboxylase subunit